MENEEQFHWQGVQTPQYVVEDPYELFIAPDIPQPSTSASQLPSYGNSGAMTPAYVSDDSYELSVAPGIPQASTSASQFPRHGSYGAMTPEYVLEQSYSLEPQASIPATSDDVPMTSPAEDTPNDIPMTSPTEEPSDVLSYMASTWESRASRRTDEESDDEGDAMSDEVSQVQSGKKRVRDYSSEEETQTWEDALTEEEAQSEEEVGKEMNKRPKKRARRHAAERFLDLEAEATDDEDDDDEGEDMDGFIAPDVNEDHDQDQGFEGQWIDMQYQSLAEQLEVEAKSAERIAASIESRYNKRPCTTSLDFNSMKYGFSTEPAESIGLASSWTVHCKPGCEDAVITFLRGCCKQQKSLNIRTFIRNHGDGYVYIDTDAPDKVGKLLRDCAVVKKVASAPNGIKMIRIDAYRTPIQQLLGSNPLLPAEHRPGTWFQLNTRKAKSSKNASKEDTASQPLVESSADQADAANLKDLECYHGDAALLIKTSEEEATVVFALRVPTSAVLDRFLIVSYPGKNVQLAYSCEILTPEYLDAWRKARCLESHGLRQISIPWKKLCRLTRSLTLREAQIFVASEYPNLPQLFPRVQCWNFEVGDDVETWDGFRGSIVRIEDDGLYIQTLKDDTGDLRFIGWAARKIWKVGDAVRHVIHGWTGFVVFLEETNSVVHSEVEQESRHGSTVIRSRSVQQILADNSLLCRHSSNPAFYAEQNSSGVNPESQKISRPTSELRLASTGRAPWIDWEILVFDKDHGHGHARVIDVQHGHKTKSGLKIIAQWTTMGKTLDAFPVDYDKVLHLEHNKPLHTVQYPLNPAFRPPFNYEHPHWKKPTFWGNAGNKTVNPYLSRGSPPPLPSTRSPSPEPPPPSSPQLSDAGYDFDNAESSQGLREMVVGDMNPVTDPVNLDKDSLVDQILEQFEKSRASPSTGIVNDASHDVWSPLYKFPDTPTSSFTFRAEPASTAWPDGVHPSHHWLYSLLETDTVGRVFRMIITGTDPEHGEKIREREKNVKFSISPDGSRSLLFLHIGRQWRMVQDKFELTPVTMSNQSRRPFIVRTGEHAGKVVVRIRMIPRISPSDEQHFACYEVNLLTGEILETNQYDLSKANLCQLVVQDDVFTDIDKRAEEIRERLNPRQRRASKSKSKLKK